MDRQTVRVSIPTSSYNPRRDGKPWLCRCVAWPVGAPRPTELIWGTWIGDPGDAGELVIEAAPGDLLRHGKNDLRAHSHTYRKYVRVEVGGTLTDLSDKEAAKYWQVERLATLAASAPESDYVDAA